MSNDDSIRAVRLSDGIVSDLIDLLRNRDQIAPIIGAAAKVSPASSVDAFSSRVAEELELGVAVVREVLNTLVNIRRLQRAREAEASRMVESLTASLERYAGERWNAEYSKQWKETTQVIVEAIDSIHEEHPLLVSEKAETLAYSHQNIVTSQRIITDIRPVFDTTGTEIKETLVLHTLLIEYYDAISPPRRIALALDSADVAALRKSCERAEGKAKAALEALKSLNPVELPEKLGK